MSMLSMTIGSWKPGIGDPSFMGWFTVFSYYFVALLCFLKMISEKLPLGKKERNFWVVMCFALIVLGFIKQFNLLTALTETGRIIARSNGWMEQRGIVQVLAMVVVCFIGLIFSMILYRRLLQFLSAPKKMAIIGLSYLLLFVIFRGISLHQLGPILNYKILGARVNWIAELFGIYWICLSIFWRKRKRGSCSYRQEPHPIRNKE
jgi:hypothetical protein